MRRRVFVDRSGEDKTVLPDGSFSAGARRLPTANDDDDDDITAVHQCVADPSDPNRRIRVVQRVRLDSSASGNLNYSMQSCDVWLETRTKRCPRAFSADPRPDVTNPNGRAWVRTLGGANFVLDWPKEETREARSSKTVARSSERRLMNIPNLHLNLNLLRHQSRWRDRRRRTRVVSCFASRAARGRTAERTRTMTPFTSSVSLC